MDLSRGEFVAHVVELIISMEAKPRGELWIKKTKSLKERLAIYRNYLDVREKESIRRKESTAQLAKTEDKLIEEIRKAVNFLESCFSRKEAKFKEFVKTSTLHELIGLPMTELLEASKYLLSGLKANKSEEITDEIIIPFEKSVTDFENALVASKTVKTAEGDAITNLKLDEDDMYSFVKKVDSFIDSQVPKSERHLYPRLK